MKSKLIWNAPPVGEGSSGVSRPRAVTARATSHHWLRNGCCSSATLPTICVSMCSVSRVSFHASKGKAGHRYSFSCWLMPCVFVVCVVIFLLLSTSILPRKFPCSYDVHDRGCRSGSSTSVPAPFVLWHRSNGHGIIAYTVQR